MPEKTVFADGTSKVLGTQDQTRFLETSISDDIYNNKKEQIKQSIRSNPQRAIAFLRANGKDVKSLAGMNPADQALQTDMWLDEIVGSAGEKYKTGEKTVSIPQKKDTSGFVWSASSGRNKNWAWSLAKGGSVNIKDKDVDVDKRLNINRVSGGVAENEFTLGTDALVQKVAAGGTQGVFDKKKFIELGGFDRSFYPAYWEDMDISYKALRKGWKLIIDPKSVAYHEESLTWGKMKKKRNLSYTKNKFIFFWKNFKDRDLWLKSRIIPFISLPIYMLRFDVIYLKAFFRAIKQILKEEKTDFSNDKRTDKEIFELVGNPVEIK